MGDLVYFDLEVVCVVEVGQILQLKVICVNSHTVLLVQQSLTVFVHIDTDFILIF